MTEGSELDLYAAIDAARKAVDGRLGCPSVPIMDELTDRAVRAAAPLIATATRIADADALHDHLGKHRLRGGGDRLCICGQMSGLELHSEHVLLTWLDKHGIEGWQPRAFRKAGYQLTAVPTDHIGETK